MNMFFSAGFLIIFISNMLMSCVVHASSVSSDVYRDQAKNLIDDMLSSSVDVLDSAKSGEELAALATHLGNYIDNDYVTKLLLKRKFLTLTVEEKSEISGLIMKFVASLYKTGLDVVRGTKGSFVIKPRVKLRHNWYLVKVYISMPDSLDLETTWFTYVDSSGKLRVFDVNISGTGSILMIIRDEIDSILSGNNGNVQDLIAVLRKRFA